MLGDFAEKKEIFFDLKKNRIFQTPKNPTFSKGLIHTLAKKKCNFLLDFDLIKIRLELMLFDFEEKKKPFLALKNRIFFSPKNRIFSKGLTHAFGQKMPNFFLT